ncbi:MAG: nitrilase [Halieaceae bacterium]|nr:nitrilase [Halieaceae bacterium]
MTPYSALALQMDCHAVNNLPDREAVDVAMQSTLARVDQLIAGSKGFISTFSGDALKLVVLPEYFLTSFPMGESIADWRDKACIAMDGAEYQRMGQIARERGVYLSGNVYELDPHFPDLYFQTSFIISDEGEVILRYRRLISMFAPTPHDVLTEYIKAYGEESLFPVVETPLGRLACVASEEILYPEVSRALATRGAEVLLHSSSEVGSPRPTPKNIAKCARAYENMCYLVSSNTSAIHDSPVPENSTQGHSQIVDFKGQVMTEAYTGESMVGNGLIDIERLREARAKPAMTNMLARQRLSLFRSTYAADHFYPADNLLSDAGEVTVPDRAHFMGQQSTVIENLKKAGLL